MRAGEGSRSQARAGASGRKVNLGMKGPKFVEASRGIVRDRSQKKGLSGEGGERQR